MNRRSAMVALATVFSVAACKSGYENGYAVDITVIADPSLGDAVVASIVGLHLAVSGAETSAGDFPLKMPFAGQRQERVIYRPRVAGGTLHFNGTASDGSGTPVASGATDAMLQNGATVTATLTLSAVSSPPDAASPDLAVADGGSDDAASDLAFTNDLMSDDAAADLSIPPDDAAADDAESTPDQTVSEMGMGDLTVGVLDGGMDQSSGDGWLADATVADLTGPCAPTSDGSSDGIPCGAADPCHFQPTCLSGVCMARLKADGAICGTGDVCHDTPVCRIGVCTPHQRADGSSCGAGDVCHDTPTCAGGVCQVHTRIDGTVCAPTANPCQRAGVCRGGQCGAVTNQPNGTICNPAGDPCHISGVCGAGSCGPQGVHPDGYNYAAGYLNRCCGGAPVQINNNANCGACGLTCGGGMSCTNLGTGNILQWWCSCVTASSCWAKCCSGGTNPSVCTPSSCQPFPNAVCIKCPGNATCTMGAPHYYCHY